MADNTLFSKVGKGAKKSSNPFMRVPLGLENNSNLSSRVEKGAHKIAPGSKRRKRLQRHTITPAAIRVLESAGFFSSTRKRGASDMSTSSTDCNTPATSERPAKKPKTTHDSSSSLAYNTTTTSVVITSTISPLESNNTNIPTTTTPLKQGTYFHLFPLLPAELRQMIWKECLPQRVIEIDDTKPLRYGDKTDQANNQRPAIAFVNYEACTVAARERAQPRNYNAMRFHWTFWQRNDGRFVETNFYCVWNMLECYEDVGFQQPMSIPAELIANFGARSVVQWKKPPCFAGFLGRFADQHPEFNIVLLNLVLHAPHKQARESGLFGHLGDEPVQLVDIEDLALLKRYQKLSCKAPSSREHAEDETEAYYTLRNEDVRQLTPDYQERLFHWAVRTEVVWVKQRWQWGKYAGKEPEPDLPRYWDIYVRDSGTNRRVPDCSVPWVLEQLAMMPRLTPKYMIRLCYEDCCTSREPDAPVLKRKSKIVRKDL